ncbi:MAG: hypothetical protein PHS44_07965, partial [Candidatus Dojkabacteria bacterium]|nr:hypothetical protein [Candidatus Dojkabacteria bacterium]
MKKFVVLLFLSVCMFVWLPVRGTARADSQPELLNPNEADFIGDAFCEAKSLNCDESISDKDILEELFHNAEFYRFGKKHTFEIQDRAIIGIEVKFQDIYTEEDEDAIFTSSMLVIKTPSGEHYAVAAKQLMVIEVYESGIYEVGLVSDGPELYNISISRLRSPFIGDFTFVDQNIDFQDYKMELLRYVELGGNVIVYRNEEMLDFLGIQEKKIVLNDSEKIRSQIDFIYDNYYSTGDEIYQIDSALSSKTLATYRDVPQILLFENSFGKGKIFVLNPSLTTL